MLRWWWRGRRKVLLAQMLVGCYMVCKSMADSIPLLEKTVRVGESVGVPCPLAAPGGSVQWLQNGAPVILDPSSRRQWRVSPDGTAALTLASAQRADAGKWECRELVADGSVRNTVDVMELVVGSSPSEPYLELEGRRLLHQTTLTVREPQKLALHCVVSGAIPPVRRIHWHIGKSNVTSASELFVEFSAAEDAYTSRSVLYLNVTRRVHQKELVCSVHHLTWMQAAAVSASLNVLYEPSFSISRDPGFGLPLLRGMRVLLQCEVDANPVSEPVWVRDDGPMTVRQDTRGALNFTPISREHSGWYRCTTQHDFGFYASFGYFLNVRVSELTVSSASDGAQISDLVPSSSCISDGRPEVTAVNRSLVALAGSSALLSGQLCSSPPPSRVLWIVRHLVFRPGDDYHPFYLAHNLTVRGKKETEIPDCWMCSLELRRLGVDDSGEVLLVVRNTHGIADALFRLNVTHAPSSYSSSSNTDLLGAYVRLTLLFPVCLALLRQILDTS